MNFFKTFFAALAAFVVGNFLLIFVWIAIFAAIIAASTGMSNKIVTIEDETILKIDLADAIVDVPSTNPFNSIDMATFTTKKQLSLINAINAIDAAASDDRIKGIYINIALNSMSSTTTLEELRAAIENFKQSGKFVVAYNSIYTQGGYYFSSVADQLYLQPEGGLSLTGLNFSTMFFKNLLDRFDVQAEIFRPTVCRYKSAVEPFIRTNLSPENRAQMKQLLDSSWEVLAGDIAKSRNISVEDINQKINNLELALPADAVNAGLVDELLYQDQMTDKLVELSDVDSADDLCIVSLPDYASQLVADFSKFDAPKVGVIYAQGEIVDGEGTDKIYGYTLANLVREAREDDDIKSVVLRVNSPGGSALASDIIWREMELLREEKPVIISMGDYAASGGYYISAPADVIVANKLTLTGSIGVFGMFFNYSEALAKNVGITMDGVTTNQHGAMGVLSPLDAAERAFVMKGVDRVYKTFTDNVAEGRNLPIEDVLEIAQGRVWSGTDAVKIGLVDVNGGLKQAIAIAADKADIADNFDIKTIAPEPSEIEVFLNSLNAKISAVFTPTEFTQAAREYQKLQEVTAHKGLLMYDNSVTGFSL